MNWKTVLLVLGAIVLGLGVLVKIAIRTPVPPAHQVFINGNVLTMDANNTVAEAVAVRSDLIEAVGSSDDIMALVTADTTVVDLRGRTLVPGFIDAHGHFPGSGMSAIAADLNSPPIGNINTMAEVLGALSERAESTPEGDWSPALVMTIRCWRKCAIPHARNWMLFLRSTRWSPCMCQAIW